MSNDRHGVTRVACLLAAILGVFVDGVARAQDPQGPIVVTQQAQWELFSLEDLQAAVELRWRRDIDDVDLKDAPDRRNVEDRLRGILELGGEAYVGHPNLLALDLYGEFWLTNRRLDLDSSDRVEHVDEFLLNYDVSGTFLQKQKLPVTLYARRNQNDVNRQFGNSFETTVQQYGVRLNYRDSFAPTNLEIYRRELQQDDPFGSSDFEIDVDAIEGDGQLEIGEGHRMWWDASYEDTSQSRDSVSNIDFDQTEANLTHTYDFGEFRDNQFFTAFRYLKQTGDLDFELMRFLERIRFRPNQSFNHWYNIRLERLRQFQVDQRNREINANFRHQLFDSLTTTARIGYNDLKLRNDDFTSEQIFGDVVFEYTKLVPLGLLEAGAVLAVSEVDQSDRGDPLRVIDQVETFDGSDLIVILGQNIIPDSFVITDLTGLIIYVEGLDYVVFPFANRVEIRRVVAGDIAAGQTVLVDYSLGPEPGGTIDQFGWGVDARYTFDEGVLRGLSVYASYFDQDEGRNFDQNLGIVPVTIQENDFRDIRYGVEYTAWRLFFRAEQFIRRSSLSPFDTLRLEGRYSHRLDRSNAIRFNAQYQQIDRDEEDIRTATTTLTGQWTGRLTNRLRGDLLLVYRHEDTNRGFDADFFDQQLDLTWRYRQLEVFGRIRNTFRNSDIEDVSFQTFQVGVRREF